MSMLQRMKVKKTCSYRPMQSRTGAASLVREMFKWIYEGCFFDSISDTTS